MITLALDPGAKRCGWAILSEGSGDRGESTYVASGILGLTASSNYQEHRLRLIEYWVVKGEGLLAKWLPDAVVSEIVPPAGGNIASIINRQLALTVVTTVQALAYDQLCDVVQIGANTVKKRIGGGGKATKVKVRNGVLSMLPELEPRRPEWTGKNAVWDEVDALAVGLAYHLAIGEHG